MRIHAQIRGGERKGIATSSRGGTRLSAIAVALGILILVPLAASAGDLSAGPSAGDCLKPLAGTNVVCTANDVKIAKALSASPTSCIAGQTFSLTATFQVDVTANERYDAAFYFDVSGDAGNDGAYTGSCFVAVLDNSVSPALNIDSDFCGDLNAGSYTNVTFTIPGVSCTDTDGDGKLNLPNCTSWHSNSRTACSTATDGTPETKSKCTCDRTFNVPVTVESPAGAVTKTAKSATVTFEVTVKNNSATRTVTVDSLVDDVYGDITSAHDDILSTNCATGASLAPGASTSACQFTVTATSSASSQTDTITARLSGSPSQGANDYVDVTGSATVVVTLNP
jgi:hypothetical protein